MEADFTHGPDFYSLDAGEFPANPLTEDLTSDQAVLINFNEKTMAILGT
jgi:ATP-dependent phosphoenolpyruvate carboxykinase